MTDITPEYTCRMSKCSFGKVVFAGNYDYWTCTHCGARWGKEELPFLARMDDADRAAEAAKYDAKKAASKKAKVMA